MGQLRAAAAWSATGRRAPNPAIRRTEIERQGSTEAVRKLPRSICAWKVLLDLVNMKTKSSGDGCPKKSIEKTVLPFLGSRTFLHGLDPLQSSITRKQMTG
jgi:hypothetical protein